MSSMDPRMAARRRTVAERRARRNLARSLVVLVVAAVVAAGVWFTRSPFLDLDTVAVRGAAAVDVDAVLAGIGVAPGVPMVELDTDAIRAALEEDPYVRGAEVTRSWPNTLVVTVDERIPVAWAETTVGWRLLADDGVVLGAGAPPANAPRIRLGGVVEEGAVRDGRVLGALRFLHAMRADLAAITEVVPDEDGQLRAFLADYLVRLGRPLDMEAKARALAAVLDEQPPAGSVITLVAPTRPAVLPPDG